MVIASPPFANGRLDRDVTTRMDPALLAAAWSEPGAQLLRLRGQEVPLATESRGTARLAMQPVEGEYEPVVTGGRAGHVYVGRADGTPVFASKLAEGSAAPAGGSWSHPFEAVEALDELEREIVVVASALLRWHESARFSSRDGDPTTPAQGGWARHDEHGGEHFPRTDPAVIVLVEHEGRVLLGSNVLWESGRFSLLAGFVEAGESLEQTVRREVFEESGVRLGHVEYVASQPWPFPRSLMLGFRARLAPGVNPDALVPDTSEISELRWFTRDQVRTPDPGIRLPGGASIARWMLDSWAAEEDLGGARD
ncbi:MAG: NAD(+) diphosphatase [Leucobacter sp.]